MMSKNQATAILVLVILGGSSSAEAAHCFCKATLKEHRTTNPADYVALSNVDGLAETKFTIPGWSKNQTWDWVASASGKPGSCWSECRKAFGVDNNGNVSAEAAALKKYLLDQAKLKGQPATWCGGWLSARLQYAAGTNQYRDATTELIGLGSRICASLKCKCPLDGSHFDSANCFVATPPAGTEPFVYDGNLYYTALKGTDCPLPGSHFDSANCFVAEPPPGSKPFVYDGKLYYTPVNGNECPLPGSHFDSANCFVASPPAGTQPFVYDGKLYYTSPGNCPLPGSRYDGANCFVGTPPAGTTPFVYDGNLYYTPICS